MLQLRKTVFIYETISCTYLTQELMRPAAGTAVRLTITSVFTLDSAWCMVFSKIAVILSCMLYDGGQTFHICGDCQNDRSSGSEKTNNDLQRWMHSHAYHCCITKGNRCIVWLERSGGTVEIQDFKEGREGRP